MIENGCLCESPAPAISICSLSIIQSFDGRAILKHSSHIMLFILKTSNIHYQHQSAHQDDVWIEDDARSCEKRVKL